MTIFLLMGRESEKLGVIMTAHGTRTGWDGESNNGKYEIFCDG